jgi:predicted tellurium resistance membrane protein TerC
MEWLSNPDIWISFLTLFLLELVLGIDNIIFISILTNKLPEAQQKSARQLGLGLALFMRFGLLFSITWIMSLTDNLFYIQSIGISGRDLILLLGGFFLIYKSVKEIHHKVEKAKKKEDDSNKKVSYGAVIAQILLLDLVFSLDSVITAVGMVSQIEIMMAAVLASMMVMVISASSISSFVNRHPAIKILALAFLILIGVSLIGESLDFHIPKGFIYGSMAFALIVEAINIMIDTREKE